MDLDTKLNKIKIGFAKLSIADNFKNAALENVKVWLTNPEFSEYVPQIDYLIEVENWDLLLDCFYQLIPFGTAGRRGEVGIGPNRINVWTLQAAAQGHAQYLLKKHGAEAKERGVIISYDVRAYTKEGDYDDNRPNPVKGLNCRTLAEKLAEVYAANELKVLMFNNVCSTPELSFMVRYKKAIAGNMVSASHNPPEYNGQKVVDMHGGQLIPPFDEELITEVVDNVNEIKRINFNEAIETGAIQYLSEADHQAYIDAAAQISVRPDYRSAKVLFSPYHGTSYISTLKVMQKLGIDVTLDTETGTPDPEFKGIMYNIPNPEVQESFRNIIPRAEKINADVIMVADPDGDRFGLMSKEKNGWRFFNGNEFFILSLVYYLEELKAKGKLKPGMVVMKTVVTTDMLIAVAEKYDLKVIPDLLVGYKYIANEMNKLDAEGKITDFVMAAEESHGMNAGDYIREKDATVPSILISELASKLKNEGKTLGEFLNEVYKTFGYYKNYTTEIRLPGAEGMGKMMQIMKELRENPPKQFGQFEVVGYKDRWQGDPFVSESDKQSRNVLLYYLKGDSQTKTIKIIIRPSGTEPKTKFYFEVGKMPVGLTGDLEKEEAAAEAIREELEKAVLKYAYKIIGIDFPDRGFLLFWQLPAPVKMKYFEIEPEIEKLKEIESKEERRTKLNELLTSFGSSPIEKVNKAFKEKYKQDLLEYLMLI